MRPGLEGPFYECDLQLDGLRAFDVHAVDDRDRDRHERRRWRRGRLALGARRPAAQVDEHDISEVSSTTPTQGNLQQASPSRVGGRGSRRAEPRLPLARTAWAQPRHRRDSGYIPEASCQKRRPPSQAIPGPPTIGGSPSGQTLELRRGAPHRGSGIPILYVAAAPLTRACIYLPLSNQYQRLMLAGKIRISRPNPSS